VSHEQQFLCCNKRSLVMSHSLYRSIVRRAPTTNDKKGRLLGEGSYAWMGLCSYKHQCFLGRLANRAESTWDSCLTARVGVVEQEPK
jgi:hypothetical protein